MVSLLFTGHMIDKPDRLEPRFPPTLEPAAKRRLLEAVAPYASLHEGATRGFASGARGGDILFHEACQASGIPTTLILPFSPELFVGTSVKLPRSDWDERFWRLWHGLDEAAREVMDLPVSPEAYALCNLHLIDRARQHGTVHLIALWDGKGGDGPGGAADLVGRAEAIGDADIFSPASLRTDE